MIIRADFTLALERILDTWPAPSAAEFAWLHHLVCGVDGCEGGEWVGRGESVARREHVEDADYDVHVPQETER